MVIVMLMLSGKWVWDLGMSLKGPCLRRCWELGRSLKRHFLESWNDYERLGMESRNDYERPLSENKWRPRNVIKRLFLEFDWIYVVFLS